MNTAHDSLQGALRDLARRGERTPCGDPDTAHMWTSDSAAERRQAAVRCAGCPVLTACAAAADETHERFNVWGGTDREQRAPTANRQALTA